MLVINLPIEPIERRYSNEWNLWYQEAFRRNKMNALTIVGEYTGQPEKDKFLDPHGTFIWKFAQLKKAVTWMQKYPKEKYVVFLHDGWFPGIECFSYLRDMAGVDVKVVSWLHAGSYDPTDLLGMNRCDAWASGSEESWFYIADAVVTGSNYHMQRLSDTRKVAVDKIHVIGYPIDNFDKNLDVEKDDLVIWPHRLSEDKRPGIFDRLSQDPRFKDVKFIKTLEHCETKAEYHSLLARAKVAVSTASHENFGISMVEAACSGAYPVVPNALAYKETIEPVWRYEDYEGMAYLVQEALNRGTPYEYPHVDMYRQEVVTDKVCNIIQGLFQ